MQSEVKRKMTKMTKTVKLLTLCLIALLSISASAQEKNQPLLSGRVITNDKEEVAFATVALKGTNYGCSTNESGMYHLHAPEGKYTLVVSAIGYETAEKEITLTRKRQKMNIILRESQVQLDEVVVMATGVGHVRRRGHSLTPSLEYVKRNLLTRGLDVTLSANYSNDVTVNIDTASHKYNWLGEKAVLNSPGE